MRMALHPSKIDLPDSTREKIINLLNARLADAVNLSTQMKQAHWNVKGPSFIALHELFDTIHADTEDLCVEISRAVDKNLWLVEAHAQA